MNPCKRYILTGGPGSGKTATSEQLAAWGSVCVPEVAREVIRSRVCAGLSTRPSAPEFASDIFQKDVEQYDAVTQTAQLVFFDRGLVDSMGMLFDCGRMTRHEAQYQFDKRPFANTVFFFPPWESIYCTDPERDQSFAESMFIAKRIREWYESLGFSIMVVPHGTITERANFILEAIKNLTD